MGWNERGWATFKDVGFPYRAWDIETGMALSRTGIIRKITAKIHEHR